MRPHSYLLALFLSAWPAWADPGPARPASPLLPADGWRSFVEREAGEWQARWDERDGTPVVLRARGAAPLPGWEADHGRALSDFFARHRDLFGLREDHDAFVPAGLREHRGVVHVRMRQLHRGLPVLGGEYMASVGSDGTPRLLAGRVARVPADLDVRPAMDARHAEALARAAVAGGGTAAAQIETAIRSGGDAAALVHVVTLLGGATPGWWRVLVDARTGAVLEVTDLVLRDGWTGVGRAPVAIPSPDDPLVDTILPRLRDDASRLEGRHVTVLSQVRPPVTSADGRYDFRPCTTSAVPYPNAYDEVSAYRHTDDFIGGFLAALGYEAPAQPLVAHVHEATTNMGLAFTTVAGTYFTQVTGLGCSAEDQDIVVHETTHHVLLTFGIDGSGVMGRQLEPLAMNEGFADYFAAAVTGDDCIGEFSYRHRPPGYGILRCIANDPAEYNYARYDTLGVQCAATAVPHCRGLIWSGALWDLRAALPGVADRLVVESLYYLPAVPCYATGYDALYAADFDHHGGAHADEIDRVFAARGIAGAGMVLGVAIAGPAQLPLGQPGTYTISGMRGVPPFHYSWSQYLPRVPSGGSWVALPGDGPEVTAASATTRSFVVRCIVTDAGGHWGADSLPVEVVVPPLTVSVRSGIAVPWGGCARDTAVAAGGVPPLFYAWWRLDPYRTLLTVQPFVADTPVTAAHQLNLRVSDLLGTEVWRTVEVSIPLGRPAVSIVGPSLLCCGSAPDTFRAVVGGGRPPYRYAWCQASSGARCAWTSAAELLAGPAIRRDSSFVIRLTVTDADGVVSETAARPVGFCGADSCRWQVASWSGARLLVASPVHASRGAVTMIAHLADAAAARLEVHDLTGRRVADLGHGALRAGVNEVRWECRGTRPGVYFVRLGARDGSVVRKVVVLP